MSNDDDLETYERNQLAQDGDESDDGRWCRTCAHYDVDMDDEPCAGCGTDNDRWEPVGDTDGGESDDD